MRAGDLIVRVNEQDIKGGGSRQVAQLLRDVKPDSKVRLRVRTRRLDARHRGRCPRVLTGSLRGIETTHHPAAAAIPENSWPFNYNFQFGPRTELRGLEVTTLTPQLGRYFGTNKGVLVVRAPAEDNPEAAGWRRDSGDRRPRARQQLAHREDSSARTSPASSSRCGSCGSKDAGPRRDAGRAPANPGPYAYDVGIRHANVDGLYAGEQATSRHPIPAGTRPRHARPPSPRVGSDVPGPCRGRAGPAATFLSGSLFRAEGTTMRACAAPTLPITSPKTSLPRLRSPSARRAGCSCSTARRVG